MITRTWKEFFDSHAPYYESNPFAAHAALEVQFLLNLYPIPVGSSVLDVGCGTGRHAREFAKRGYRVTGVDLSPGMLAVAREKADEAGLDIEFVEADAKTFTLDRVFDAAVCLCEGGLGLINIGEDAEAHDRAIFHRIAAHLKPNASFVLTCLNGYSLIRQMKDELIAEGRFDPATMIASYTDEWDLPEGKQHVNVYERLFIPPEVTRMVREAGFKVDNVYGGTAGAWAQRPLSLDEVEMMVIARKL
ncbi:SmtA SAM-dependent methyltransferases [Fimbriimonadaceae bacterium]